MSSSLPGPFRKRTHPPVILKVHLERLGALPEEVVKFYVAEIGSALAFLHEHRIIHR